MIQNKKQSNWNSTTWVSDVHQCKVHYVNKIKSDHFSQIWKIKIMTVRSPECIYWLSWRTMWSDLGKRQGSPSHCNSFYSQVACHTQFIKEKKWWMTVIPPHVKIGGSRLNHHLVFTSSVLLDCLSMNMKYIYIYIYIYIYKNGIHTYIERVAGTQSAHNDFL